MYRKVASIHNMEINFFKKGHSKWTSKFPFRGVINGKAGKAADLPKLLETLTLFQSGVRLFPTIGFASPKDFRDYAPALHSLNSFERHKLHCN